MLMGTEVWVMCSGDLNCVDTAVLPLLGNHPHDLDSGTLCSARESPHSPSPPASLLPCSTPFLQTTQALCTACPQPSVIFEKHFCCQWILCCSPCICVGTVKGMPTSSLWSAPALPLQGSWQGGEAWRIVPGAPHTSLSAIAVVQS